MRAGSAGRRWTSYPYVAGSTVLRADLVDGVIDVVVTWSRAVIPDDGRRGMLADVAAEWGVRPSRTACEPAACPGGACYFQMRRGRRAERVIALSAPR
jgi:N-acyl-D-amino-acid deacylase